MTRPILAALALVALAACVAATPREVRGCGGAYRPGERVDVADETALIVWDEATKTQHFIRQATFVGTAYDFGFLVPTPSRPKLEPASPALFTELAKITEPKTEIRHERDLNIGCGGAGPSATAERDAALPAGFVVLEQKRVGDLDAAVLGFRDDAGQKPEDAALELLAWLTRNQYAVRPELSEWLVQYVRDKWIITAFKIAGERPAVEQPGAARGTGKSGTGTETRNGNALKATAVRMSFKTDRPFFPYREPADQRDGPAKDVRRLLRVFVAAKQRMAGKLGHGPTAWPGMTVWANAVTEPERISLLGKAQLTSETPPGAWHLTEFEDRSTPRPGTDEVYFEASADQSPVARHPRIIVERHEPWWFAPLLGFACAVVVGVPMLLLVGIILYIRRGMRLRQAKAAA